MSMIKWRDDFYLPVAEKTMEVSKFMFVNIMDPKIQRCSLSFW